CTPFRGSYARAARCSAFHRKRAERAYKSARRARANHEPRTTMPKHHFTHRPSVSGPFEWEAAGEYTDILYHKGKPGTDTAGIAKVTINRPEVRNAFRPLTVQEMQHAFADARDDASIGVIVLTGEGPDAF